MFSTYGELELWLRDHHIGARSDSDEWTLKIVRELSTPDVMQGVLKLWLNDTALLETTARRSYAHRNGFDKIVLLTIPGCLKLRLHVWPPRSAELHEDIHNHRWNFASFLLAGAYRFQTFALGRQGVRYWRYAYRSPEGEDHYHMALLGEGTANPRFDGQLRAGSSYYLQHEILHRVVTVPDLLTISLMCQGPNRKPMTTVLTDSRVADPEYCPAAPLATEHLAATLREVLKEVTS